MKTQIVLVLAGMMFLAGCANKNNKPEMPLKTVNHLWLDSLISKADSSLKKPYKRTDFVTAEFYVNRKDSTITQLMKDSAGTIRQIIVADRHKRIFFAQYYANGQQQADLPL